MKHVHRNTSERFSLGGDSVSCSTPGSRRRCRASTMTSKTGCFVIGSTSLMQCCRPVHKQATDQLDELPTSIMGSHCRRRRHRQTATPTWLTRTKLPRRRAEDRLKYKANSQLNPPGDSERKLRENMRRLNNHNSIPKSGASYARRVNMFTLNVGPDRLKGDQQYIRRKYRKHASQPSLSGYKAAISSVWIEEKSDMTVLIRNRPNR